MKAISLFSGGLDSQLSICLIKEQGIEVIAMNFTTPFFGAEESTSNSARALGVELKTIHFDEDYMDILKHPVYGYGKNMNPCIDCHAYMQKRAALLMEELGASFLISGEVLGQRPMSQTMSSLNAVDKLAGVKGLLVRPLSAQRLAPTIAETNGWIDRSKLLDISGRTRTRQMELAKQYGLVDYPTPAGGCLLTQENFSKRLRRYLGDRKDATAQELNILKYGRQIYLGEGHLLMVGRNQAENAALTEYIHPGDYVLRVLDRPGPTSILRAASKLEKQDLQLAAQITARYSDARDCGQAQVKISRITGIADRESMLEATEDMVMDVVPLKPEETPATI